MLTVLIVTISIVLSVIVVGLIALVIFILKYTNSKFGRQKSEHQQQLSAANWQMTQAKERLNRVIATTQSAHESELERREAEWKAKVEKHNQALELVSQEKTKLAEQFAKTFDFSDLTSRQHILHACQELQLDGALLTNIYFSPASDGSAGKGYYSQADHLLVTTRGAAVIEGKYWSTMVFDGVKPADKLPELKPLLQGLHLDLRNGDVLHVFDPDARTNRPLDSKRTDLTLSLKVYGSPHRQAKKHALRLHTLINEKVPDAVKWIDTCVYYSYASAKVHHAPTFNGTSIVAGKTELKQFISGPTFSRDERFDVKRIVEALRNEAGDVCGFGEWRQEWPSHLS